MTMQSIVTNGTNGAHAPAMPAPSETSSAHDVTNTTTSADATPTPKRRGGKRKPLARVVEDALTKAIGAITHAHETAHAWKSAEGASEDVRAAMDLAVERANVARDAVRELMALVIDNAPVAERDFKYEPGDLVTVRADAPNRDDLLLQVDDPSELNGAVVHKIVDNRIILRTESGARLIVRPVQIVPADFNG
jgi:hypothetical protein